MTTQISITAIDVKTDNTVAFTVEDRDGNHANFTHADSERFITGLAVHVMPGHWPKDTNDLLNIWFTPEKGPEL